MIDLRAFSAAQTSRDDLAAWDCAARMVRACAPPLREPIIEWCERTVDMSYDLTARCSGPLRLYPYQRDPLAATEDPGARQISLMWSPRLGKSTIWKMSLLPPRRRAGGADSISVTRPGAQDEPRHGGAAAAERAAAERAAAERAVLSDRERDMQKRLGGEP